MFNNCTKTQFQPVLAVIVATESPGTSGPNDCFIFVTDPLLTGATNVAGPLQLILSYTDSAPTNAVGRFYGIKLAR
jgi:hypothetical protein